MSKISTAESRVMEALWVHAPMTAEEIVRSVGPPNSWGEATVRTLINRLMKKGAVASDRNGVRASYRPLVTREEYVTGESQGLLDRLFGGQIAPLVAHYARQRALSPQEIGRLKTLIAQFETDNE
jgi:predicted transcriptional regulator